MDDVAHAAGVSRALVSLVMRDKVSEVRRERVLRTAERLGLPAERDGTRPREQARTRTVGVLLNELHNPFYAEIMDGIEEAAAEHDYRVLIGTGGRRPRGEEGTLETFLELRADGIVLVGPRLATRQILAVATATPVVVVARDIRSSHVDSIKSDERAGARQVVRHLVELGHRRIAHVDGEPGAGAGARREGLPAGDAGARAQRGDPHPPGRLHRRRGRGCC